MRLFSFFMNIFLSFPVFSGVQRSQIESFKIFSSNNPHQTGNNSNFISNSELWLIMNKSYNHYHKFILSLLFKYIKLSSLWYKFVYLASSWIFACLFLSFPAFKDQQLKICRLYIGGGQYVTRYCVISGWLIRIGGRALISLISRWGGRPGQLSTRHTHTHSSQSSASSFFPFASCIVERDLPSVPSYLAKTQKKNGRKSETNECL